MEAWLLAAGIIVLLVGLHNKRGWSSYAAYRRSPVWQKLREEALLRDKERCRVCNSRFRLEVHHRCYRRWGTETVDDLTTLCHDCHSLYSSRAR